MCPSVKVKPSFRHTNGNRMDGEEECLVTFSVIDSVSGFDAVNSAPLSIWGRKDTFV
jgi:hypothetical protein